ncbi:bifunctional 2-polyprenyl-6-hydroxyphenol methylase/3-demethylubiquinol 3-O-methyltransferase UbiG [Ensifer sp. BR816]|uniref:class I SAM-dependent methyltransferase n=1 Tax=Rhizobium sp. (strain BR816) TaxID=1057002 RepID=UPI0012F76189|nr:class I SAM-dependent methyltransferase [Ensifer sp. BR816]
MKKLAKKISRRPLNAALADFVRTIPEGSRVLNIGSGGEVMDVIRKNQRSGVTVLSTDIDPERKPDFVDDITATKLDAEAFDHVICAEVLEHVREPFKASENIHKILKPGGRVFVSTPFQFPLHDAPHDYFRYTEFGLANIFQNFRSTEVKPRGSWGTAILLLILRSLWFKNKRIDAAVHLMMLWNLPLFLILRPVLGGVNTPYLCSGFVCSLQK